MNRSVEVDVPASSANLGVGFDVVALALDLQLRIRVTAIDGPESSLSVEGEGRARLALDESNRFLAGFQAGWREVGDGSPPALEVVMENEIPLGRGLGSSAAATVAGLLAAEALAGSELGSGPTLRLASEMHCGWRSGPRRKGGFHEPASLTRNRARMSQCHRRRRSQWPAKRGIG